MALVAGIVGLPNVGKSTLFSAITRSQVEIANYPFSTINPNIGVVNVPDERLLQLAALINPDKMTFASFQFADIAGLVKGASKGEGLGNQFLSSIREVDAICHVVRCFASDEIVHVEGGVDPLRDIEIVNLELILSDAAVVQGRIARIGKKAHSGDREAAIEASACKKLIDFFDKGRFPRADAFSEEEMFFVKNYNLISMKKVIYVANIAEEQIANPRSNPNYLKVEDYAKAHGSLALPISARIEAEISVLEEGDQKVFMRDLGIKEPGLSVLSRAAHDLLGLATFFTFGKKEVKAWTFRQGMLAPQCAGVIHSDFERGFIKCETVWWEDLVALGSEQAAREAGKMRMEGKDYAVKDGDVCHFRFNVSK